MTTTETPAPIPSHEEDTRMTTTTTTTAPDPGPYVRPDAADAFDLEAVPEEYRETMRSMILDPETYGPDGIGGAYVTRQIDGTWDMDVFARLHDARLNLSLHGPTGSAKTGAARAYAALHGLPFASLVVNGGMDPVSAWAIREKRADGSIPVRLTPPALVVKYGGVLNIDEYNLAHPKITASLHNLTDDRRELQIVASGDIIRAHPALFIVGTMNPGYSGTSRVNEAFARRFRVDRRWEYSAEVEQALIPSPALLDFARKVRDLPEVRTDLSTDHLVTFVDLCDRLSVRFAAGTLVDSFAATEQGGVRRALALHLPAIAADLGADLERFDLEQEEAGR